MFIKIPQYFQDDNGVLYVTSLTGWYFVYLKHQKELFCLRFTMGSEVNE